MFPHTPLKRLLPWLLLLLLSPAQAQPVRLGLYHNPPKIMADAQGQPSGIFGDLIGEIAREEGWQLEPVPCQWQQCLEWLAEGRIDLMPDVAFTEERATRFDFHRTPALLSWSQIYTLSHRRLTSLLELDGKRLAVLRGSVQQQFLGQLVDSFGLRVEWLPVDGLDQVFDAVASGRADAAAANHFIGNQQAASRDLVASPILFQPSKLYFAVPAGTNPALLARIDHHLQRWQSDNDSRYFDILTRWSGRPAQPLPPALWWSLGLLLSALLLAICFNLLLRRKVAERTLSLQASEHRLNTILDSVEACIYIKDEQLRYQYANRRVCELFGVTPAQILGQSDERFFDAETCALLQQNDLRVLQQGERVAGEEVNGLSRNGERRTFLSVKLPLRRPDGRIHALCGISTDITEYRRLQEELHQLAFFDSLTGLANRRLLLDRLRHALAGSQATGYQGALVLIDLDNFKDINDTRGHDCGDQLLQQTAARLRHSLAGTDTAGRLGSDEFVLIMEDLSPRQEDAVMQVRNRVRQLLERLAVPYEIAGKEHRCSASIGIAMFSDAQGNIDELLKAADLAMFAAKADGRNTLHFFNQAMQDDANRRSRLEHDLRLALERDELELHLQPQVDAGERITGMEALLRWQHPELGRISPADFIPLAESSGLIIPLGDWVLAQACRLLAEWRREPAMARLGLAVNISPRQFRHPDFVAGLQRLLQDSGVDPARLELEITESLLIDDIEQTIGRMEQLRRLGLRFSLDDFGTGYASLGYLKRLPLSQLKIDQSFVRDLLRDPNDEAIVRTIIALGRSLDLQVIAEGVETAEQASRLQELGCTAFQGYWFGKPDSTRHWHARLSDQAETEHRAAGD
ncbi:EAL domain-containing protein [Zobellella denitrificans]|uniref:EAL domain-containing protein n=1 Tax=Zobellella denitrificans TaxID=347534 RepID=UPI000BBEE98F|nr:EAL domain-containing protein [Zobellella denitrificans]